MHELCARVVLDCGERERMHRMFGRDVLDGNRRFGCGDMPRVSCQFLLAYFQRSPHCLHV